MFFLLHSVVFNAQFFLVRRLIEYLSVCYIQELVRKDMNVIEH
jgi:hypothetical protein